MEKKKKAFVKPVISQIPMQGEQLLAGSGESPVTPTGASSDPLSGGSLDF